MKKITLFLLTFLCLSCNKEVNCSGTDEKQVYFDLLSESFEDIYAKLKEKNDLDVLFDLPYDDVKKDFFKEMVKLEGMRPSKIEKELKKCECEAELTAEIPEDMLVFLTEKLKDYYTFDIEELKKPYKFKNVKYNLQLTEDGKIYCETFKKDKLEQAFIDYSYFKNIINNYENGLFDNLAETESKFENGIDWLNSIFVCKESNDKFCFPVEDNVCSERFLKYMSEKSSIYGPSNYTIEESKIAEKKYKENWGNIYKILEDDIWLFGRGNGDVEGLPIRSVKIKSIDNYNYEIDIDFDGEFKTKNYVKLVKVEDSYLIDFCETNFY